MTIPQILQRIRPKIKRGAVTRIAEYCGVSNHTVNHWLAERWEPGASQRLFLEDIARGKVDLSAKKTGPSKIAANGAK